MKKKGLVITMKRKVLSLALALVMLLVLMPATTAGSSGGVTLGIPKTQYAEGERVWVTVTGITQEMINNRSWVGVYTVGGAASAYWKWEYVKTVGTEIIPLDLPRELGTYEIRFVPQNAAAPGHSAVSQTLQTVLTPPVTEDIGDYLWSGEWNTPWGKMTIRQNGSSIEGEYETSKGRFEGTVHGNTMVGKYAEESTYLPPNNAGLLRFWMSEGGNSFEAGFCYGYDHPKSWSLRSGFARLTPVEAVPNAPSRQSTPGAMTQPAATTTTPSEPTTSPAATPMQSANFTASAIETGVKLDSNVNSSENLGYRIFRSTTQGQQGVSITDFAIGGTSFADVNVQPDTTYYYTLYAVFKEATASGEKEVLSEVIGTATVKTNATITGTIPGNEGKTKSIT